MANQKISDYTALAQADVDAAADLLEIVDVSTGLNKKITPDDLVFGGMGVTAFGTGVATALAVNVNAAGGLVGSALIDAAGDLIQGSAADTVARLAIGAAGTRLHSTGTLAEWQGTWFKVGSFTRDVSTASGTQAVTGVGFMPKAIIFIAGFTTPSGQTSIGFSDGTNHFDAYDNFGITADTWGVITSQCITLTFTGVNSYTGVVSALGADGFTITWTKNGTPTGTATIGYLALR